MSLIDTKKIRKIYELLEDEESKIIFENRVLFSITQDYKFIRNVACTIDAVRDIHERLKKTEGPIGIFGAGGVGKRLVETYNNIKFSVYIDNMKKGTYYQNLRVCSIEEYIDEYPDGTIVIASLQYYEEIYKQLIEVGCKETNIINIGKEYRNLIRHQYFDLPYLPREEKEVFVDGGAYDGNTTNFFFEWCAASEITKNAYSYVCEPDYKNIEKCMTNLREKDNDYQLVALGLWNQKDELSFSMDGTSSKLSENGETRISVDSIQNICLKIPTFIKMDIEGSESQAILGAKKFIAENKPKLAICLYHKPEDVWELPFMIHEINPDYRFYMRHYSFFENETVLYAV